MNEDFGTVYWITGLSGAGKTTIGQLLFGFLKNQKANVVFLDGDVLRDTFQNHSYDEESRRKHAYNNMRLARLLAEQGIDVVMSVIGMKDEFRDWNRKNINSYVEIYLKVPMETLISRDSRGIYKKQSVYGKDLVFEEPKNSDIVVVNDGRNTPNQVCDYIIEQIEKRRGERL